MKIFCHQCGKTTNHECLCEREFKSDPNYEDPWGEVHRFTQCKGCDSFTYAIESWSIENWNPYTGAIESEWKTYPHGQGEREAIKQTSDLPPKVRLIYKEVIGAINAQLPVLTGIGLRALIEAVCREQGIEGKTLEALITGLADKGILSRTQADILHTHRFLGNAAAHEITPAQPTELVAALDIAENVLRTIYVLPGLSKQVKTGRKTESAQLVRAIKKQKMK